MTEYKLDNIDWKILDILQSDASISNLELSEKVFLRQIGWICTKTMVLLHLKLS